MGEHRHKGIRRTKQEREEHSKLVRSLRDGDYVYTQQMQGVYYRGGIIMEDDSESDEPDKEELKKLQAENLRAAAQATIKVRNVSGSLFFSKGKLMQVADLVQRKKAEVLFINAQLSPIQERNLSKRIMQIIEGREERLRKYFLKSAEKQGVSPTDSDTGLSDVEIPQEQKQKVQLRVVDRFGVILQIFASRAISEESRIQIELAWLMYSKSRLVRGQGSTFVVLKKIFGENAKDLTMLEEREVKSARGGMTRGAVGGSGEKQLELERRRINDREAALRRRLKEVENHRSNLMQRNAKQRIDVPVVALIGYTNAGKTALLNWLGSQKLESQDALFVTLSTVSRRVNLDSQMCIMVDTVGFISRLPHPLVASFRATLEQALAADIILHVRDMSHPSTELQRSTVLRVLKQIGIDTESKEFKKRCIEVWNKVDLLESSMQSTLRDKVVSALERNPEIEIVPTSAKLKLGGEQLLNSIRKKATRILGTEERELKIPAKQFDKRKEWLRREGGAKIVEFVRFDEEEDAIVVKVTLGPVKLAKYQKRFESDAEREKRKERKKMRGMPPEGW